MFQNSSDLRLEDIQAEYEEQRRLNFTRMLKKAFQESGLPALSQPELQALGIDPGAFWRATTEKKDKYKHPQRTTLYRWCNAMYKYARRIEDRQRYVDIMLLAGYAAPQQVREALKRTTEELAIQKTPNTETLGELVPKSCQSTVSEKRADASRQFKAPLDKRL